MPRKLEDVYHKDRLSIAKWLFWVCSPKEKLDVLCYKVLTTKEQAKFNTIIGKAKKLAEELIK